jgi:hypothetical protein
MPRAEVGEGRSFNPDEFAILFEQIVAGTAPKDYTTPLAILQSNLLHPRFLRTCLHGAASLVGQDLRLPPGARDSCCNRRSAVATIFVVR